MKKTATCPLSLRIARAVEKRTEEPDFAPEPTDPETLEAIQESIARERALAIWDYEDDELELDECGNPIPGQKPRKKPVSWDQRCKQTGVPQACQRFFQKTAYSAMMGAALISRQPKLLWSAETLLEQAIKNPDLRAQASCGTLLNVLREKICRPGEEQEGYAMLFSFLIEPFALMNQSAKHDLRK